MGMHTHQCTQNYFQKYKCKILTPQVMPFRNLIAILYSLLPLRLIFVLQSKNTCLRLSTIFCKYTKPWSTEISSSSDRTFLMKPLQNAGHTSGVYLSKTEKKSFKHYQFFIAEVSQGANYSSGMKVICGLFLNHFCIILHFQSCDIFYWQWHTKRNVEKSGEIC